jgi:hypothetical protein
MTAPWNDATYLADLHSSALTEVRGEDEITKTARTRFQAETRGL